MRGEGFGERGGGWGVGGGGLGVGGMKARSLSITLVVTQLQTRRREQPY